jgi:pimeloyl-ACP methyl ester carboxylesterase
MPSLTEINSAHTTRVTLDDERTVCLERAGHGQAVILIHGAVATRKDMVIGLGERLVLRFDVLAVDRPGHGESTRPRLDATLLAQATAIRAAVQKLGVERPVLVGHSMGGAVAMTYAVTWPDEVAGVVALSPCSTRNFGWSRSCSALALPRWLGRCCREPLKPGRITSCFLRCIATFSRLSLFRRTGASAFRCSSSTMLMRLSRTAKMRRW